MGVPDEAGQSEPLPPPPSLSKKTKKRSPSSVIDAAAVSEAAPPPAKRSKKEKPIATPQPRSTKAKPAATEVDPSKNPVPSKKRARSLSAKSRHPAVVVPPEPASLNAELAVPPQTDPLLSPPSLLLTPLDPALGGLIADDASRCDSSGDTPMVPVTGEPVFYEDTQSIQPPTAIAVH